MTLQPKTVSASKEHSLSLAQEVYEACMGAKGLDVTLLDVSDVFDLADYFVVVSGRSDRHVQGICNRVGAAMKGTDADIISLEGFDDGHWVLMDYGDVVVHVFYEPLRDHYDIEGLWLKAKRVAPEELPEPRKKPQAA